MIIKTQIKQFVAENMLFSGEDFPYPSDASFLQEGIIDSLGVMELVTFVQTRFNVSVEMHEVTPDNFDSVDKLAAFIQCKLGRPEPAPVCAGAASHD